MNFEATKAAWRWENLKHALSVVIDLFDAYDDAEELFIDKYDIANFIGSLKLLRTMAAKFSDECFLATKEDVTQDNNPDTLYKLETAEDVPF